MANLYQYGTHYSAGGNINVNVAYQGNDTSSSSERPTVADWLNNLAPTDHYAIQSETYSGLAPETASWILCEPKFDHWLTQNSGTLWGVGIPGAGKTMLTSYVIDYLQDRPETRRDNEIILFAYARFDDSPTISNIFAALLSQLCEKSARVLSLIHESIYTSCMEKKRKPTEDELIKSFRTAVGLVTARVFIVVDALDEIRDDIREGLVEVLCSLNKSIFLTSRELSLSCLSTPDLRVQAPTHDLRKFIAHRIKRHPQLWSFLVRRQELLREVIEKIVSKSDGMFLLAALQLFALGENTTSVKILQETLNSLPTRLTDMYELTLRRIMAQGEQKHILASRAILWVTYATRSLTVSELFEAMSIGLDSTELDPDAVTNQKTLISVCCGLLTIEKKTSIIRLIHYTAHDFFSSYRPGLCQNPHTFTFTVCVMYLKLSGFYDRNIATYTMLTDFAKGYPFADYACRNMGHHASQSITEGTGETYDDAFKLLSQTPRIPLSHKLMDTDGSEYAWSLLHYGGMIHFKALFGILPAIENSLQELDVASQSGCNPLYYATLGGHTSLVRSLLHTKKVNVNAPNLFEETALHLAASLGHKDVVQLLLGFAGVEINARGHHGHTALHCASMNDQEQVVQMLLGCPEININAVNADNVTALHIACEDGNNQIVKLLLGYPGININASDRRGSTALHLASLRGREQAVRLLLGYPEVIANAQDFRGDTPLHYALRNGYELIARLLLRSHDEIRRSKI